VGSKEIMPTTVANRRKLEAEYPEWQWDSDYVYIGRRAYGHHYGNPFSHLPNSRAVLEVGSRKEAVEAFEQWLDGADYEEVEPDRRQWILDNMEQLRGKTLVCFCHPQACHGHVYAARL
jgi:hypothetical protein